MGGESSHDFGDFTSGTSKHTKNNAHKMVGILMELLSNDLKVEVKVNVRFSSLEAGGDIKGMCDLVEEKVCGVGDGTPKILSWVRHLKNLLNSWQLPNQTLATYQELKEAQRAFVSRLNEGGVTLAPDFLVHQIFKEGGKDDNEIKNLKYGSDEIKEAKKEAEEQVLTCVRVPVRSELDQIWVGRHPLGELIRRGPG